jgi:PTS system mannose-specific IIB component
MSIEMVRIDDRLIHGQVVAGWCPVIHPDRLILCDDEVAGSEWESHLYEEAAFDYDISVCSVTQTVEMLKRNELKGQKIFIVAGSPKTIVALLANGLHLDKVIVGGMHYESGKRRIADFIFINDDDLAHFRTLANQGVTIEAKDVPTCKPIDVMALLGFK